MERHQRVANVLGRVLEGPHIVVEQLVHTQARRTRWFRPSRHQLLTGADQARDEFREPPWPATGARAAPGHHIVDSVDQISTAVRADAQETHQLGVQSSDGRVRIVVQPRVRDQQLRVNSADLRDEPVNGACAVLRTLADHVVVGPAAEYESFAALTRPDGQADHVRRGIGSDDVDERVLHLPRDCHGSRPRQRPGSVGQQAKHIGEGDVRSLPLSLERPHRSTVALWQGRGPSAGCGSLVGRLSGSWRVILWGRRRSRHAVYGARALRRG
ncbi:hypothetical protein SAMN04489732_12969 [Amycolatopsis saalfeldensis]|uniref:Uncharacterized protein n=1 Tax=Amycolatopsis saalfeldensis TaxID=394193 RepID=A0A1H8YN66_9PSEU|nr:hypothetical protein SAMN04489732_12969 [Amycolatopsis saalfeldensis]